MKCTRDSFRICFETLESQCETGFAGAHRSVLSFEEHARVEQSLSVENVERDADFLASVFLAHCRY